MQTISFFNRILYYMWMWKSKLLSKNILVFIIVLKHTLYLFVSLSAWLASRKKSKPNIPNHMAKKKRMKTSILKFRTRIHHLLAFVKWEAIQSWITKGERKRKICWVVFFLKRCFKDRKITKKVFRINIEYQFGNEKNNQNVVKKLLLFNPTTKHARVFLDIWKKIYMFCVSFMCMVMVNETMHSFGLHAKYFQMKVSSF